MSSGTRRRRWGLDLRDDLPQTRDRCSDHLWLLAVETLDDVGLCTQETVVSSDQPSTVCEARLTTTPSAVPSTSIQSMISSNALSFSEARGDPNVFSMMAGSTSGRSLYAERCLSARTAARELAL